MNKQKLSKFKKEVIGKLTRQRKDKELAIQNLFVELNLKKFLSMIKITLAIKR